MSELARLEEKLLAKLMDYLSYSPRTEKEVRSKAERILEKRDLPENADLESLVEKMLSILREENLVDDELYARRYLEGLVLSPKNKSVKEAMNFLYKKGIPKNVSDGVIQEFGEQLESKSLKALIEKKARAYGNLKNPISRKKLIKYLVSKGFRYESARSEVDKIASLK